MHLLRKTHDVVLERGAASGDHDLYTHVLPEVLAYLCGLQRKLTCRDEQEGLDLVLVDVDLLKRGNDEGCSLTRAVLGTGEDVAFGECDGDGLLLDWRGPLEAGLVDAHEELPAEVHVFKFDTLCCGDIFGLRAVVFWWRAQTCFPGVAMAM